MPRPDSSVVERGPEKAGVGGSIPSLATITATHTLPILTAVENFNVLGHFEDRAFGCVLWRKYKTFHMLAECLPRTLYIGHSETH